MRTIEFTLSDGRTFEIIVTDNVDSKAVVFHHGTPSCALSWNDWISELESDGISAIAYSRAGYSVSSRDVDRQVIDVNDDLSEVLEHFGVTDFVAVGWSGGGPHALAAAIDSRCRGVVVIAGVGAFGQPDLNFLEGMGLDNEIEFGAALAGPEDLAAWMKENGPGFASASVEDFRKPGNTLISEPDFAILQGDYAYSMVAACHQSCAVSFDGWIDDDLAFTRPWGFAVADVNVPVHIWQGTEDLMVPAAHGDWLHKHLPMSELHRVEGEGHISIGENHRVHIVHNIAGLLQV